MEVDVKITRVSGTAAPIYGDEIDTDRIIPARFLKEITFEKMGEYLFYDVRFDSEGNPLAHTLNEAAYANPTFLVVGKNFGCGSSREHAPQAIRRFGVQALIGDSFAEIFLGNCKAIGIVAVTLPASQLVLVYEELAKNPQVRVELDLETQVLLVGDRQFVVEMPQEQRTAFLAGTWDATALLADNLEQIKALGAGLPYAFHFLQK